MLKLAGASLFDKSVTLELDRAGAAKILFALGPAVLALVRAAHGEAAAATLESTFALVGVDTGNSVKTDDGWTITFKAKE